MIYPTNSSQSKLVLCSIVTVASFALGGCAVNMPQYAWTNAQDATVVMAERDEAIKSFSATCRILLEADAGTVELRGAIVAKPTDNLRIRAWKMSQTVFDVTLNNDGLFLYTKSRDNVKREPIQNLTRDGLIAAATLLPGFSERANWTTDENLEGTNFIRQRLLNESQGTLTCQIDKRTLTTTRCDFQDSLGMNRQTIQFFEYRMEGGVAWPIRIVGDGEGGAFEIRFDDAQINPELNPKAFVPPRRAVKQP